MQLSIRQAVPQDVDVVADILREAARWLEDRGIAMWRDDELLPSQIADDVHSGLFFLAECDGEPVGTIRFQLEDKLFWPDIRQDDSAFVHRLAVRRLFSGGDVSSALLLWAIAHSTHSGAATCAWIAKHRARACERSMSVSDLDSTATGRWDHTSSQDMSTT